MSALSACRMCLAVDARMYKIAGTPLQDVYEKMTDIPLLNGDQRPEKVCYLCHHLLRKNQAFMEKSVKADELLKFALDRGLELSESTFEPSLAVCNIEKIDIAPKKQTKDLALKEDKSAVTLIKEEPLDDVKAGVEPENSASNEEQGVMDPEAEINTMLESISGCVKYEDDAAEMTDEEASLPTGARVSEDRKLDQDVKQSENIQRPRRGLIRDVLTSEYYEANAETKKTAPEQRSHTNATNEAQESDVAEVISNVKRQGESSTDVQRLGTIPRHQLGNNSKLTSQRDPSVSSMFSAKKVAFCEHCGMNFKSLRLLNNHSKIDHSKVLICNYCSRVFHDKSNLIRHVRTHVANITIQNACSKTTAETKIQAAPKRYLCDYCNDGFSRNLDLVKHLTIHSGSKPHRGNLYNKAFGRKDNLQTHLSIHTGNKTHQCSYCQRTFPQKSNLNTHMLIHTGEKPHQCSYCNKAFRQKGGLKAHLSIHTGEKPHQCSYCQKSFSHISTLRKHILIHTGDKPHQCSYCNKAFRQKGALKTHLSIHTGDKPHQSSYCKKSFTQKAHLNRHMLIHTGEKLHQCSYCQMTFPNRINLNKHILIHTGEKPHQCSYCKKSFFYKSCLKRHMLIHTEEKPHRCSYCDKGFSQRSHLKKHLLIHTGEKPHRCSFCNKAFTDRTTLQRHMTIHTGKNDINAVIAKSHFLRKVI